MAAPPTSGAGAGGLLSLTGPTVHARLLSRFGCCCSSLPLRQPGSGGSDAAFHGNRRGWTGVLGIRRGSGRRVHGHGVEPQTGADDPEGQASLSILAAISGIVVRGHAGRRCIPVLGPGLQHDGIEPDPVSDALTAQSALC